jgi:hypothetical protein
MTAPTHIAHIKSLLHHAFGESKEKAGGAAFREIHSIHVATIVEELLSTMSEVSTEEHEEVVYAALLHDYAKRHRIGEDGYLRGSHAEEELFGFSSHEILSAHEAQQILTPLIGELRAHRVAEIITSHSDPKTTTAEVLHDADELAEMGLMNFWKMATYSAIKDRSLPATILYWFEEDRQRHLLKSEALFLDASKNYATASIEMLDMVFKQISREIGLTNENADINLPRS